MAEVGDGKNRQLDMCIISPRTPMPPEISRLIIHIPSRDGFLVDGARIEKERLTLTVWHTPQELVDASVRIVEERGYSLGVDWPYKGTIVPFARYGKDKYVALIILEVKRKLFLEDNSSDKNGNCDLVRQIIQDYLNVIASNVTA